MTIIITHTIFILFPFTCSLKYSRDVNRWCGEARIEIKHNEFIRDKNTETFSGHLRNKAEILKQIHSTLVFHVHAEKFVIVEWPGRKNTIKFHSPGIPFIKSYESTLAKATDVV
jgi:hypothetical protein